MNVKMFQMGFGESILLYADNSCLLVDCGSESSKREDYFRLVKEELAKREKKSLLITHFHTDHINGISKLGIGKNIGLDRVYLPCIFSKNDKTLDLVIIEYLLEALLDRRRKNIQVWKCLIAASEAEKVIPVRQGCNFEEVGCHFKVLWPIPDDLKMQEDWTQFLKEYELLNLPYEDIYDLARITKKAVRGLARIEDEYIHPTDAQKLFSEQEGRFAKVREDYVRTMMPILAEIKENVWEAYKDIKKINETSIVFQTTDGDKQILMTGDISHRILKNIIENDSLAEPNQKKHFDIIKAPHHGTQSCYFDFSKYYDFNELYVSNGETTYPEKTRGKISGNYRPSGETYKVFCTNAIKDRCEIASDSNDQCLSCCDCCCCVEPI